jgi:hypothetical protein
MQNYFTVRLWGSEVSKDGAHWTTYEPGQESPFAGRGSFYQLHYGNYLIGMNCTKDKTYELNIPTVAKGTSAPDLISGQTLALQDKVNVPPQSTVVLSLKN